MFLEKSAPGVVGSFGMIVCRRIVNKHLELKITYQSRASKAGEVLSFVIREVNTFTSVAMKQSKPLV